MCSTMRAETPWRAEEKKNTANRNTLSRTTWCAPNSVRVTGNCILNTRLHLLNNLPATKTRHIGHISEILAETRNPPHYGGPPTPCKETHVDRLPCTSRGRRHINGYHRASCQLYAPKKVRRKKIRQCSFTKHCVCHNKARAFANIVQVWLFDMPATPSATLAMRRAPQPFSSMWQQDFAIDVSPGAESCHDKWRCSLYHVKIARRNYSMTLLRRAPIPWLNYSLRELFFNWIFLHIFVEWFIHWIIFCQEMNGQNHQLFARVFSFSIDGIDVFHEGILPYCFVFFE